MSAATWTILIAAVTSALELLDVDPSDIYVGERAAANYSDATYVLKPQAERVATRANGGLVLCEYPLEVEFRSTVQEQDGEDRTNAVIAAHDGLIEAFDGAVELADLDDLERITVEVLSKSASLGRYERETVGRLLIRFPVWETRSPVYVPGVEAPWYDSLVPGASFIFAGESLMWQDEAGTTLATADGDPVRRVQDARGLPIFSENPTGSWTLRVSGSLRWIENDGTADFSVPLPDLPYQHSVQSVSHPDNTASTNRGLYAVRNASDETGNGGAGGWYCVEQASSGYRGNYMPPGGALVGLAFLTVPDMDADYVVYSQCNDLGNQRELAGYGQSTTDATARTTFTPSRVLVGKHPRQSNFDGLLKALIVYPFTLGSAQREANAAVLAARFGISL